MNLRRRPPRHAAEMLLQWLTLACLAVSSMTTSAGPYVILDSEPRGPVTFPSGSTLSFKCGLNTSGYERLKVIWLFNPNESSAIKAKDISNLTYCKIANESWSCSSDSSKDTKELVWHLPKEATPSNSGWYFCCISQELPIYSKNTSNGTRVDITEKVVENTTLPLLVTEEKATQSVLNLWLLIPVGVSAVIVLLLICVLLKIRCCKKRAAEQPIYANTKTNKASNKPILKDTLKPIPCSEKVRNPRYDEG